MAKPRANPRLAKMHRNYTVEEVATLYSVHRNTVRQWIKAGLPVVDQRRPVLVLGAALAEFLRIKRTASPIRGIFKQAFEAAGLPYFNPHSFRRTLAQLGETMCQTPEQFKAWSQNLGHEGVLTTFYSYGSVAERRQGEIIKNLALPQRAPAGHADELAQALVRAMRQGGLVVGPR